MNTFSEYIASTFRFFVNHLKTITLIDLVDIVLVAVLLYYSYIFIRERRAGKLALGVILLIFIQMISSVLNMVTLKFILQNVFQVGLIALIIVFQPELRSVLEKVGSEPLKSLKNISETKDVSLTQTISNITGAVCDLAKDKTGALIVIERSTKLGDIIKTGTVINSDVSQFLIKNIFFNKAPLHDGAMVIRNDRIYAAGCFLPLSNRTDIIKDLGTRHRAAIGMSENSDALVIVVSEETGNISIAVNGELKRNYNYTTLMRELTETLSPSQPKKSALKKKNTHTVSGNKD